MKYSNDIEEFKCLLNKIDFDKYLKNTKDENYDYIREILLFNMVILPHIEMRIC